jgi:transposase InsO family protein
MPRKIDSSLKERAVRMLRDHRQDYPSDTALAEAVATKLGLGRETVRRLLVQDGVRRGKGIRTTVPGRDGHRAGDLLDRCFTAPAPNRVWVAAFTYCRSWAGFVYVAFVVDVFAQRIAAWHAATTKAHRPGSDPATDSAVGPRPAGTARPGRAVGPPHRRRPSTPRCASPSTSPSRASHPRSGPSATLTTTR